MPSEQVRRASRLVAIEDLLRRNRYGLTVREIARELGYSTRTIQRDLAVLESELGVPLMQHTGRRWRLMPGSSPIGAVRFTVQEARAVYLAIRLLMRHADELDPDGIAALQKLAGAVPPGFQSHVLSTVDTLVGRPPNRAYTAALRALTLGWIESSAVRIRYRSTTSREEKETVLEPYLIEPGANGFSTYVVGLSRAHAAIRTFKIERIRDAAVLDEPFAPVGLADLRSRLDLSWAGAVLGGDEQHHVVLEFDREVADRVAETFWHPSQRLTPLDGGRLRFEIELDSLLEFVPWVRSWGPAVVVVGPPELHDEVARSLRAAAARYAAAPGSSAR